MPEKKIAIIADPYTASLYRLLGATVYEAPTSGAAEKALEEISKREDIGLVFIAAEYYDVLEESISSLRKKRKDITVSILPTVREKGRPMDVQKELLKALGMG